MDGSGFVTGDFDLVAPIDAESRHVVVQQVFMLVVAYHDQDINVRVVELFGQVSDGLLVPLVALLELLRGNFLCDFFGVDTGEEVFVVGRNPVRADEFKMPLVSLAAPGPTVRRSAQLRAMG